MSESFPLPTEPEGVIPSLIERFNSGKVEVMMALYAPEAVFIANDGRIIRDRTEIAAQFRRDMSLGLPLKASVRHVFVGDDTAQQAFSRNGIHPVDTPGQQSNEACQERGQPRKRAERLILQRGRHLDEVHDHANTEANHQKRSGQFEGRQ